jgi:2-desacetyl-2-hydroxyethyl bacteriochlorophyllide A dehydrogenase
MPATMEAAVLADVGTLALEERPLPTLARPDDVLLEIECCGICGTDLHILSVPPGHPASVGVVLGHEMVGIVQEVGDSVASLRPGDRVVVAANTYCGQCVWCRRGLVNHCESFSTYGIFEDGGLARNVVVSAQSCFTISHDLPRHVAALAEPLSSVVNGARLADVFPGDTAVVLGAGPIGLMFTALLKAGGATVLSVEPAELRAAVARAIGAEAVVRPQEADPMRAAMELTDGLGADVVVDAVGSQLPNALELVRKGGRVVLFGINEQARAEVAQSRITRNELTVLGGYVGLREEVFPTAVRLLEQGSVDLEPLVTHRIGLAELPGALEELRAGRAVKVEVEFSG